MAVYLVALLQHDNNSQGWVIYLLRLMALAKGGGEGGNDQEERRSKG